MASGPISKRTVDALEKGATVRFLWDKGGREQVNGFGVRVTPSGTKSYVFQYRMGGREKQAQRITIGKHGVWTPDQARARAKELAQMVDRGINPAEQDRERRRQAVDLAFSAYVDTFASGYLDSRWKRADAAKAMLVRDAVPVLGSKPLPQITRADLSQVWDRLADRPGVARLMHATLRKLFRWALGRGDIERSPMDGIEAPATVPSRDRVLSDDELALIWKASGELGPPFMGFYRLLILTGQRREEVAGLRWSEIDRSKALWTLPAERAKNSETHLIPLSTQAMAVLRGMAGGGDWPTSGLIFSTTGKTPLSGFSKAKKRLDEKIEESAGRALAPWRVHDFRRTVATGLQRLGVRFEVTEAVLNHVSGSRSGVAGVYQRHNWADEKRHALRLWGHHVRLVRLKRRGAATL